MEQTLTLEQNESYNSTNGEDTCVFNRIAWLNVQGNPVRLRIVKKKKVCQREGVCQEKGEQWFPVANLRFTS